MNQSYVQFQIKNLQAENAQRTLEAIMVTFIATLSMIVLPQLLLQYVYATEQLLAVPKPVELIPVIAYVIALAYSIFAIVTNMTRSKKIAQLKQDLSFLVGSETDMGSAVDEAELKELEKMVDEAIGTQTAKKSTRKVATKKRK